MRIEVKTSKHTLKYTQVQAGSFIVSFPCKKSSAFRCLSLYRKRQFHLKIFSAWIDIDKDRLSSEHLRRRRRVRWPCGGSEDCRRSNRPDQVTGEVGVCITEHNTPSSQKRCFNPVRITLKSFQPNQSRTCSLKDTRNDGITRCG